MNLFTEKMSDRLFSSSDISSTNITYLGGISKNYDQIGVMISNYDQESCELTVQLEKVPWVDPFMCTVFRIDDDHDFSISSQSIIDNSTIEITVTLEKNSVQFLHFTNTSIIPEEGPVVYDIPWMMNLRFLDPVRALLGIALMLFFFG